MVVYNPRNVPSYNGMLLSWAVDEEYGWVYKNEYVAASQLPIHRRFPQSQPNTKTQRLITSKPLYSVNGPLKSILQLWRCPSISIHRTSRNWHSASGSPRVRRAQPYH